MDTFAKRINAVRVKVKAPGVEIYAELQGRDQVTISFGRDVYRWISERHLERHLSTLARLLLVGWMRAYRAALTGHFLGHALSAPGNAHDQAYLADRERITAAGQSPDGRIRFATVGLTRLNVTVADGTLQALSEQDFVGHTRQAVAELIRDYTSKVYEVKMRFYA